MALTSVFDQIGTQPTVLGNEIITNAGISYMLDVSGVSERYFDNTFADGDLMRAAKQGVWISGISLAGRLARSWFPMINIFGDPVTSLQSPIGG